LNESGRIDLRYEQSEPQIALLQYRFQAYIESGSTGGNSTLFRIGNGATLNSISNTAISLGMEADGNFRYEYNDGTGGRIGSNYLVGLDTVFEVSLVFNATADESEYNGPEGLKSLAAGHYDLYIDNVLIAGDLPALSPYSGTGVTRMWFLSGTGSVAIAPTIHLDNIIIYSDGDVAVPPGGVDTFWGQTVVDGYIDSGTWLGWLNIEKAPWIYSLTLDKWIYCPQGPDADISLGAWAYFLR
jgi:hypothetical protein